MNWPAFLTRNMPARKPAVQAGLQQKASLSGPVVAVAQVGKPRWTPRRYDALAEEGFRKNVIAWRCISEVAKAGASIPFLLYTQDHQELEQHPLLELLQHPNPLQSMSQFMESVYSYYNIVGNVYIEAIRPDDGAAPVELYVLRPDRMRVIPGESGLPMGYEYQVNGRAARWVADPVTGASNILHWKAFHPLDDWYGMAPLEAAMATIDQYNAASAWNQALLNQAARPSGALIYSPKDGPSQLSEEQFRRLKEELEDHYLSPRNAGRPLILEGGLEWKEMGLTPKDMDWLAGRKRAAQDIALAFGVPDQLIGISEAQTFANMAEGRIMLYEETVLPLAQQFKGMLNRWLVPMFDSTLRLDIDVDEVPALVARRDKVWDKVGSADFLTRNEKRAAVGYPPDDEADAEGLAGKYNHRKYNHNHDPENGQFTSGAGDIPQSELDRLDRVDKPIKPEYLVEELAATFVPALRVPQLILSWRRFIEAGRRGANWGFGKHKSVVKWANRIREGNWIPQEISTILKSKNNYRVENRVNRGNPATQYNDPETERFIVYDEVTDEVLQVSRTGMYKNKQLK